MSKVGDLYIELTDLVAEAIECGCESAGDVMDYLEIHHIHFPLHYDRKLIQTIMEESCGFGDDDGQPDEAQEWKDFDSDC